MSGFPDSYARDASRTVRRNLGPVEAHAAWQPAQPDDTPGELVPGEGDLVDPPWLEKSIESALGDVQMAEKCDHQAFEDIREERDRFRLSAEQWTETARVYATNADDWRAKADAMRPVVEAAKAFVGAWRELDRFEGDGKEDLARLATATHNGQKALVAAVDTLQEDPTRPLSATLPPVQPSNVATATDGVGEQGEAQGGREMCSAVKPDDGFEWCHCTRDTDHEGCHRGGGFEWGVPLGEQIPPSSIHSEGGSGHDDDQPMPGTCPTCNMFSSSDTVCTACGVPLEPPALTEATPAEELLTAIFAKPPTETDQPTDPPWLEEAIEAAGRARMILWGYDKTLDPEDFERDVCDSRDDPALVAAIRAALPLIAQGVLEEAGGGDEPGEAEWTMDETGSSNSSEAFLSLCGEVERLIRSDAHALLSGNAGGTARLILAQLAHRHGLVPKEWLRERAARQVTG